MPPLALNPRTHQLLFLFFLSSLFLFLLLFLLGCSSTITVDRCDDAKQTSSSLFILKQQLIREKSHWMQWVSFRLFCLLLPSPSSRQSYLHFLFFLSVPTAMMLTRSLDSKHWRGGEEKKKKKKNEKEESSPHFLPLLHSLLFPSSSSHSIYQRDREWTNGRKDGRTDGLVSFCSVSSRSWFSPCVRACSQGRLVLCFVLSFVVVVVECSLRVTMP